MGNVLGYYRHGICSSIFIVKEVETYMLTMPVKMILLRLLWVVKFMWPLAVVSTKIKTCGDRSGRHLILLAKNWTGYRNLSRIVLTPLVKECTIPPRGQRIAS
jgi:hypothetical protein